MFVLFGIFFVALSFLSVSRPFSVANAQPVSIAGLQPMTLTIAASNGTQIVLDSTDIANLPSYRAAGGYKNSIGTLVGPDNYTGVPLTTLLNLVGGITPYNTVNVVASDNYTWALTYDQITDGNFTTYNPVTGNPVQHTQPLTPMLAYYKDDVNLTSEEGPLRLVVVGPEGLLTDSKLWVKFVTTLEVLGSPHVTLHKTVVGQGYGVDMNVTLVDSDDNSETFNVTAYANTTSIGSENVTLPAGNSTTLTFTWNTTDFVYGNYTISAYALPAPGETNTAYINFTGGTVEVTIPGDVNGDGTVNILDAITLANAFLATPSNSNWNPNADINGDGVVNILDAIVLGNHFLQHFP